MISSAEMTRNMMIKWSRQFYPNNDKAVEYIKNLSPKDPEWSKVFFYLATYGRTPVLVNR